MEPSLLADLDEIDVVVKCPICFSEGKLTLKKLNGGEEYHKKSNCPCGGARLDCGFVFGDYYWDWVILPKGNQVRYDRYRQEMGW